MFVETNKNFFICLNTSYRKHQLHFKISIAITTTTTKILTPKLV